MINYLSCSSLILGSFLTQNKYIIHDIFIHIQIYFMIHEVETKKQNILEWPSPPVKRKVVSDAFMHHTLNKIWSNWTISLVIDGCLHKKYRYIYIYNNFFGDTFIAPEKSQIAKNHSVIWNGATMLHPPILTVYPTWMSPEISKWLVSGL